MINPTGSPTGVAELASTVAEMGAAGSRLDAIHACEAGAGNISVAAPAFDGLEELFPDSEAYELPMAAPALAGWTVLVTGSGCRLREIGGAPTANLAAVVIGADGCQAALRSGPGRAFTRPTSEFNSHLAIHQDQVARGKYPAEPGDARAGGDRAALHAVVHAQPPHLVALTHRPDLGSSAAFSRRILRWEPETVVQLPEGVAVLPFMVPGSDKLAAASVRALRAHRVVLWSKHGLIVRSENGPLKAVDLIEYAETGAMYDQANTACGSPSNGLTTAELRAVIKAFNVRTTLF
ncbi:MAG: class II aldolase/adducin family protein [Bifidobacteriaceae bacterium]|jgi:rhamnulose-1-phosphate aldolase|nr:class II aldolase/adducin family protein [Bifidobacteriaceae bacterium]